MRTPLIVGNWKMHTTRAEAEALVAATAALAISYSGRVDVGIAPPALWTLSCVSSAGIALRVYGQDAHQAQSGAFTGAVSATMFRSAEVRGVLVGHSERRHVFGDDETVVAAKVHAALDADLDVILCVGETLDQREADSTDEVVLGQAASALADVESLDRVVIAYEPVWAIGTGRTASPEQAQAVHATLRAWAAERFGADAAAGLRIQYGGSVKPSNAAELLGMPDIDGALVGGASLVAGDFAAIVAAAAA